jgi:hypothetical protein
VTAQLLQILPVIGITVGLVWLGLAFVVTFGSTFLRTVENTVWAAASRCLSMFVPSLQVRRHEP